MDERQYLEKDIAYENPLVSEHLLRYSLSSLLHLQVESREYLLSRISPKFRFVMMRN